MKEIHENYGINPSAKAILAGAYLDEYFISEEQAAWFRAIKQTRKEKYSPAVFGYMDKTQYQQSFKVTRERTSSLPARLHYTIWKAIAECDYLAEFQCVMLSLSFIYGFFTSAGYAALVWW